MTSTTSAVVGHYHLVRLVGRGGMSEVHQAVDERTGATVALKIVRSADPALGRRLTQEARVLEHLSHPNLVRLLDSGLVDGAAYLVMVLVEGPTLAEFVARHGTRAMRPEHTAVMGMQLAGALAYVHAQGIVHRDVKPSNILLNGDGRAMVGDFGISRLVDASTITVAGTTLGTVAYMAPEQLEDHQVGPGADVWSLGIVLLECLTGRRVYDGPPGTVVARRLAAPVPLPADLPVAWRLLLVGMLDHRPEARLDAASVAALLATAPFRAPWDRAEQPPRTGVPSAPGAVAHVPDLTALAAAPAGTSLTGALGTLVASAGPSPGSVTHGWRARRALFAAVAVGLAAALVAAAVVTVVTLRPHRSTAAHSPASTSSSTTTTSTTTPSTTTTTVPDGASALGALVHDVAADVDAGTIDPPTAAAISADAQRAVDDQAAGNDDRAANDLQQASGIVSDGAASGSISDGAATALQADLADLAGTLGVRTPTTTTSPFAQTAGGNPRPGTADQGG